MKDQRSEKTRSRYSLRVLVGLMLLSEPLVSQTTARQGKPEKDDPTEFRSPMVLETPFLAADPLRWDDRWFSGKPYVDLRRYRCEGLSVDELSLRAKRSGERVNVQVRVRILNPDGNHDKATRLRFDLHNGDEAVASAQVGPFKVEEGDRVAKAVHLSIPASNLVRDPMTTVKITVSVQDK